MKVIVLLAIVVASVLASHLHQAAVIGKVGDFLRKKTKFGDIYLHREHEHGEEVHLEESFNPVESEETFGAVMDTVLDATKNPEHHQEFLACNKGKHSEFFKFGAAHVGYIGNHSNH